MSEYRQNMITREWALIAPERKKRLHEVKTVSRTPEKL